MRKLQQLHDELIKHNTPERIHSWAEDIRPEYTADGLDDGFVVTYKANYLISGISQDNNIISQVVFFIGSFDQYNAKPVFNTDVINKGKIDLMIEVKLTEQANLVEDDNGDYLVNNKHFDLVYEGFSSNPVVNDFVEYANENA